MEIQAIIKHYNQLKIHRKLVKEICEEKWTELYNSPLYNDELLIKDHLKADINTYKRIHLLHDLSSYNPQEFFPFANWLYGKNGKTKFKELVDNESTDVPMKVRENFQKFMNALQKHYQNNKHHWNYNREMTREEVIEMIVDWEANCREHRAGNARNYYIKNYNKICISPETRVIVEDILELNHFSILGFSWDVLDTPLSELKFSLGKEKFNKLVGKKVLDDKVFGEINMSLLYELLP